MDNRKKIALTAILSFLFGFVVSRNKPHTIDEQITSTENARTSSRLSRAKVDRVSNADVPITTKLTLHARMESALNTIELASTNPVDAIKLLRSVSGDEIDEYSCRVIFEMWAQTDPHGALDFAQSDGNKDIEYYGVDAILGVILERSAEDAVAKLSGLKPNGLTTRLTTSLFSKWANLDATELLRSLHSIQSPSMRFIGISEATKSIGKKNPEQGIQLLGTFSSTIEKDIALAGLVAGWSKVDPESTAKYIDEMSGNSVISSSVSISLLQNWAIKDPVAALKWAALTKGSERTSVISNAVLFMQSSTYSSEELINTISQLEVGHDRDNAFSTLIVNWKGEDYQKLAEIAYAKGSALPGTAAESALVSRWALLNPKQAEDFMNSRGGAVANPSLAKALIANVSKTDPAKAVKWICEADPDGGRGIAKTAIDSLMNSNPGAATKMFESLSGRIDSNALLGSFSSSYASNFPEEAIAWVNGNQDEGQKNLTGKIVFDKWVQSDQYAASQYIETMPSSQLRNIAISSLAGSLAASDIASSLKWATAISDETTRKATLRSIANSIDFSRPNKYEEAILESGLDSNEIEFLERLK